MVPGSHPIAANPTTAESDLTTLLHRMATESEAEILVAMPAGDHADTARALAEVRAEALDGIGRGVATLLLCETGAAEHPAVRAELEWRIEAGLRVRVIPRVPQWMIVFDGTAAVLPTSAGRGSGEAIVVREQSIATSVRSLFAGLWHDSTDLVRHREPIFTDRHREVLSLMNSGATDEVSARKMDVSLRTYRRYVAEAMTALGATSRFQAGVLAVRRDWVRAI